MEYPIMSFDDLNEKWKQLGEVEKVLMEQIDLYGKSIAKFKVDQVVKNKQNNRKYIVKKIHTNVRRRNWGGDDLDITITYEIKIKAANGIDYRHDFLERDLEAVDETT